MIIYVLNMSYVFHKRIFHIVAIKLSANNMSITKKSVIRLILHVTDVAQTVIQSEKYLKQILTSDHSS